MKEAQDGWKFKVSFPAFVPLFSDDYGRYEVRVDREPYIQLESSSNDRMFPGECIEVVPRDAHLIEYEANNEVYRLLRLQHKVTWQFFTPNAPVIEGEKPILELQEF